MSIKNTFLAFALIISSAVFAQTQQRFTISGTIKDSASGEELIGVIASVKELPATGVSTNEYGFYSITLPEGNYTLIYSYLGYKADSIKIALHQNVKQSIRLASAGLSLKAGSDTGQKTNANVTSTQTGN